MAALETSPFPQWVLAHSLAAGVVALEVVKLLPTRWLPHMLAVNQTITWVDLREHRLLAHPRLAGLACSPALAVAVVDLQLLQTALLVVLAAFPAVAAVVVEQHAQAS
jgi:hypothetical protein